MTMKPMSTLSFNGEDAFEIKDSEAREALDTLNTELDKSKREISEQIGVLERLQPDTAMVGHILEVDSVDETGKPLTYRAVENKPDIEVDDTLTQEGMAADAKATGEALKNISVDETLTLEEYQALSEEEKNSDKTFYIKDANIIDIDNVAKTCAKHIAFDNTNTTLTSKEVQGALVEVDNKLANKADCIVAKASGEVIVVTDSDEQKPLGLAIDGKSEQNQYSGKNLLDCSGLVEKTVNGVTFTPVYDKNESLEYIEVNGTNNGNTSLFFIKGKSWSEPLPNDFLAGEYIFDCCPSGGSGDTYYSEVVLYKGSNANSSARSLGLSVPFTINNEIDGYVSVIAIKNGYTANKLRFYPMIRLATVTDGTYEPYCGGIPSPNPSYPQEIRNIGVYDEASGKYAVEVNTTYPITDIPMEQGAISYYQGYDYLTAKTESNSRIRCVDLIDFENDEVKFEWNDNVYELVIQYFGTDKLMHSNVLEGIDEWHSVSPVTLKANGYFAFAIRRKDGSNITPSEFKNVELELWIYRKGTTTATVYLDEPLRKEDKAYWNDEKFKANRNSGYRTIRDTDIARVDVETSGGHTLYRVTLNEPISNHVSYSPLICNAYYGYTSYDGVTNAKSGFGIGVNSAGQLIIKDNSVSTADELVTNIGISSLELIYNLTSPITEEIDIDLGELTMFYPTTILSNDCNANMEVEYVVDTKTYIAKLENKIVEQNQRLEQQISEQNKNNVKVAMFTVSVEASASTGVLGNNYGFFTISNELKELNYSSIMAIFPASATHASSNGINGVIGRYSGSSSDLTTWSLATPSAGTYTVTFVVIYK